MANSGSKRGPGAPEAQSRAEMGSKRPAVEVVDLTGDSDKEDDPLPAAPAPAQRPRAGPDVVDLTGVDSPVERRGAGAGAGRSRPSARALPPSQGGRPAARPPQPAHNNPRTQQEQVPVETQNCPICMEDVATTLMHYMAGCTHAVCFACLRDYVTHKLEALDHPITCPLCRTALSGAECRLVLEPCEEERLGQLEAMTSVPPERRMICPHHGCSQFIDLGGADPRRPKARCPYCSHHICAACRSAWHSRLTCQEYQERLEGGSESEEEDAFFGEEDEEEFEEEDTGGSWEAGGGAGRDGGAAAGGGSAGGEAAWEGGEDAAWNGFGHGHGGGGQAAWDGSAGGASINYGLGAAGGGAGHGTFAQMMAGLPGGTGIYAPNAPLGGAWAGGGLNLPQGGRSSFRSTGRDSASRAYHAGTQAALDAMRAALQGSAGRGAFGPSAGGGGSGMF